MKKKSMILFVCVALFISLGASTIHENVEAKTRRLLAELADNTRSISYVEENYYPPNYSIVMNVNEVGCTNQLSANVGWHKLAGWNRSGLLL